MYYSDLGISSHVHLFCLHHLCTTPLCSICQLSKPRLLQQEQQTSQNKSRAPSHLVPVLCSLHPRCREPYFHFLHRTLLHRVAWPPGPCKHRSEQRQKQRESEAAKMFSTLRYTADSSKEAVCIEQASNPPGQSHGQQHSACNHCRAKKVRIFTILSFPLYLLWLHSKSTQVPEKLPQMLRALGSISAVIA